MEQNIDMSDLTKIERRKLERSLGMASGYVLNFSDRTFEEFVQDTIGDDIYDEKYNKNSGSKANRMRAYWDLEGNSKVAKILEALANDWDEYTDLSEEQPPVDLLKIIRRLKESTGEIAAPKMLGDEVEGSITTNEQEVDLDKFHLSSQLRNLMEKLDNYEQEYEISRWQRQVYSFLKHGYGSDVAGTFGELSSNGNVWDAAAEQRGYLEVFLGKISQDNFKQEKNLSCLMV